MALRIIDARSGQEVNPGGSVTLVAEEVEFNRHTGAYIPLGISDDSYRLIFVRPGIFTALVETESRDGKRHRGRLPIRYLHPSFLFQRVLFIPT